MLHDDFFFLKAASLVDPQKNCTFNLSETHKYELQLRTSLMPEGFNMLTIVEKNGRFITPYLTGDEPCHIETNPYNYGTLNNVTATTQFCCRIFA